MKKKTETFKIYGFFAFECFRVRNSYFIFCYLFMLLCFAFLLLTPASDTKVASMPIDLRAMQNMHRISNA